MPHVWAHNLGSRNYAATYWTLYNSYDTTNVTIGWTGKGHTPQVDNWYEGDFIDDVWGGGYVECIASIVGNANRCQHWHIYYDHDNSGWSDRRLRALACHETGHTLGLLHPFYEDHGWAHDDQRFGCMRILDDHPSNYDPWLRNHNVGHLAYLY